MWQKTITDNQNPRIQLHTVIERASKTGIGVEVGVGRAGEGDGGKEEEGGGGGKGGRGVKEGTTNPTNPILNIYIAYEKYSDT